VMTILGERKGRSKSRNLLADLKLLLSVFTEKSVPKRAGDTSTPDARRIKLRHERKFAIASFVNVAGEDFDGVASDEVRSRSRGLVASSTTSINNIASE